MDLLHAMGTDVVLALLQKPPSYRNGLAEAVFAAIIDEQCPTVPCGLAGMASGWRASIDDLAGLTPDERHLLFSELLQRIATS